MRRSRRLLYSTGIQPDQKTWLAPSPLNYQKSEARPVHDQLAEPITTADVTNAQSQWASCVTKQDVDGLLALYDFGTADAPLLFKPTLADVIRHDEKGARAYFVGGDSDYPADNGFLKRGWTKVDFQSAAGPIPVCSGLSMMDMGHYTFTDGTGADTHVDYTFVYHKRGGRTLITLHHSSLTWSPAS